MKKKGQKLLALVLCMVTVFGMLSITASAKTITQYRQGDIFEFGWYPQSKVTDTTIIERLNAKAPAWDKWTNYGYYSGSGEEDDGQMKPGDYMRYVDITLDGAKYRGVKFTAYRPYYTGYTSSADKTYQNTNGYRTNTVHWFKFDPLQWRVLDPADGLVLCETIIDSQAYNNYVLFSDYGYGDAGKTHYANNYAESSLRRWLNSDFYYIAFSKVQQGIIETTTLENKAYDTAYSQHDSASTKDKIFLLTYSDVKNTSYGFSSNIIFFDANRRASGSDYAKCQGLVVATSEVIFYHDAKGNGCSYWWLRSAGSGSYGARGVDWGGRSSGDYTYTTSVGVRPAFKLNLKSNIIQSDVTKTGGSEKQTFFQKIAAFFERIGNFFRGLFGLDSIAMQNYLNYEIVE